MTDSALEARRAPMVSNEFGTVFPDRVGFYAKRGWFGGGSLEELPMRHVTSVKLEIRRNAFGFIFCALVALVCFFAQTAGSVAIGVIFVALGLLAIWGAPRVRLNTAGGDLRPAHGAPWQKAAAKDFVSAVRKALFAE